jgi:hypothetical protein
VKKTLAILFVVILSILYVNIAAENDTASGDDPVLYDIDKSKSNAVYHSGFEVDGFEFNYTVRESILDCKLVAPSTGWVRLGLRPVDNDSKYNIIIGRVTDTHYSLADCFISRKYNNVMLDTKIGGANDITDTAGYEENGKTILFFSLPLESKDEFDTIIGNNMILITLECSDSDDLNTPPVIQTSFITALNADEDTFKKLHK